MDPETDTNPIDRSIAQLLFYRPSGSAVRPSNDALSLESEVIVSFCTNSWSCFYLFLFILLLLTVELNKQIHGSMTNLPVHDQLVCQEDIACDADMKVPITEQ